MGLKNRSRFAGTNGGGGGGGGRRIDLDLRGL